MILSCGTAVLAAGMSLSCQDHTDTTGPRPVADFIAAKPAIADGYVVGGTPNLNTGSSQTLSIAASDRILVRFDQAEIAAVVGSDSLAGAVLQLTIFGTPNNWSAPYQLLSLHRVTQSWTEAGATWNCAVDADPGNGSQDCVAPNTWVMGTPESARPFVTPPTSTAPINNSSTGVIQFNVTADVRAFLAGTANLGWILRKADEGQEGQVSFGSKESVTKPQLLLGVVQGDTSTPQVPASFTPPANPNLLVHPSDTEVVFYRDIIGLSFKPGTSGSVIRGVLSQFSATIIGGSQTLPAMYFVQVPDPGPSLSQAMATVQAMRNHQSVASAILWMARDRGPEPQGRYPNDGSQARRVDWFSNGTDVNRAFLEARMHLAWGCETGRYGTLGPTVGVIDYVFDTAQADFRQRTVSLKEPTSAQATYDDLDLGVGMPTWHHGTAVAGILGAASNNDSAVVGAYWGGTLRMYGFARGDKRVPNTLAFLILEVVPQIIADNVRVLNVSLNFAAADDAETFENDIYHGLRFIETYLNGSPKNLLVVSAANQRIRASATAWANGQVPKRSAMLGAIARLKLAGSPLVDRILLVAGTDGPASFWDGSGSDGSNHMADVSVLAAGSTNRRMLSHSQGPGGQALHVDDGTSYAAPLVAGAAALLMTFDSTLTGAQVKQYLLRPSVVTSDGVIAQRPQIAVPGGGTVYQLDAYSALHLVASERPNLPVCGYPVRLFDDFISVRLDALGPAARTLTVPGATGIQFQTLSVAQGGRRIAAYDWALDRTVVMNHLGQLIHQTATGVRRSYLEEDTVDAVFNAALNRDLFTIHGDSTHPNVDFFGPVLTTLQRSPGSLEISPDGTRALVHVGEVSGNNPCYEPPGETIHWTFTHSYFVPRGGPPSHIRTEAHCNTSNGAVGAWNHSGTRATFAQAVADPSNPDPNSSAVVSATVGQGSPQATTVPGQLFRSLAYSPDDSLLLTYWLNTATDACFSRWMVAATHQLVGTDQPASFESCFLRRIIPNAPPAYPLFAAPSGSHGRRPLASRAGPPRGVGPGQLVVRVN